MSTFLPRWKTGISAIDAWLEKVLGAIEKCVNTSYQSPLYVITDTAKSRVIGVRSPLGLIPAITTSTVAGGSYGSPVSVTVSLLDWDGSALSDSGVTQDCWMAFPNTAGIGSGKLVWIAYFAGAWFIVEADCTS
jgi:hypothetical protein